MKSAGLFLLILFAALGLIDGGHFYATWALVTKGNPNAFMTLNAMEISIGLYAIFLILLFGIVNGFQKTLLKTTCQFSLNITLFSMIVMLICDVVWIFYRVQAVNGQVTFPEGVMNYAEHTDTLYTGLLILIGLLFSMNKVFFKTQVKNPKREINELFLWTMLVPLLSVWGLTVLNVMSLLETKTSGFLDFPLQWKLTENMLYAVGTLAILKKVYSSEPFFFSRRKQVINLVAILLMMTFILQVIVTLTIFHKIGFTGSALFSNTFSSLLAEKIVFAPLMCLLVVLMVFRTLLRKKSFYQNDDKKDPGRFGSAHWANGSDLHNMNVHNPKNGIFSGTNEQGVPIYLPLMNKLTLSPPGGGKTTCSSIPVLLSHNGPAFVFDIKGELWAVTARYRAQVLKRKIVVIDPYKIRQNPDFKQNKPPELLSNYKLNPFDWIPEERDSRDRMINAFAASLIVRESNYGVHFDENAKMLIRGYIDFIMSLDKSARNLNMLFHLMSDNTEKANFVFEQMTQLGGRAKAAANQINRVGSDERGSILSTSYRQIDWMSDSNMQETLSESNFDLREFLAGNMDIYILLPEDQVKEHNRLVRMVLSLLMGLIVQANPSQLPKQKMLFLLDELAQLGYCPDVEQCIEVLRARGVVVWSVFQTLSQIEAFKKPDLFKGAAIKQIFTNDDTKTMQWIQTLAGKKTIYSQSYSSNTSDSREKTHLFKGNASSGDGQSRQETGVDLMHLNEIRELPYDEQYLFLQGYKPIHCKKVRYFEHPVFAGCFDPNPLEI